MKATLTKGQTAVAIVLAVIIIDQIIKVWVKTSFYLGEDVELTSWFHMRFIENPGMAFGMTLGNKLFLTIFRIIAVSLLIWYITRLCRDKSASKGYVACIALITAGAGGNIIDCVFYGEIFNNPFPPEVASVVPWGDGYGELFHGMVVDMFYFPLFSFTWPEWVPLIGGKAFSFLILYSTSRMRPSPLDSLFLSLDIIVILAEKRTATRPNPAKKGEGTSIG